MKRKTVDAKAVELKPALSLDEARTAMRAAGTQKSVVIRLLEWKGDSLVNVGLTYELELRVFDRDGKLLTSKLQQGRENLGSGNPFTPGGSSEILPRFRRMMETLFQDREVVKALQP